MTLESELLEKIDRKFSYDRKQNWAMHIEYEITEREAREFLSLSKEEQDQIEASYPDKPLANTKWDSLIASIENDSTDQGPITTLKQASRLIVKMADIERSLLLQSRADRKYAKSMIESAETDEEKLEIYNTILPEYNDDT